MRYHAAASIPGDRHNSGMKPRNSNSSVVWNPWIAKSAKMADFPNDGYKTMICVETAHANEDARTVAPGESLEMVCIITSKKD